MMVHQIDMKKIENKTRRQVTFSKRRSSLIKKAHEISVCCDVDVAMVAFSPSGRLTKFSTQNRVEDVLDSYINLPADERHYRIANVEEKQQKLQKLNHINGDGGKLHHLNKQVEHMELHTEKATRELQTLESNLRDYEPDPEQEYSLAQLMWCERNLKKSLQHVMDRKRALLGTSSSSYGQFNVQMERERECGTGTPFASGFGTGTTQNDFPGQLLKELDPWLSPYSRRVRENIFEDLLSRAKGVLVDDQSVPAGRPNNYTSSLPTTGFQAMHQQSGISSMTPQTQFPPTYTPMQQPFVGNYVRPILPNQQLGLLDSSSMGMQGHNAPVGGQKHPPNTYGHHGNNLNRQDGVMPMFQHNTNPEQMNWFGNGNHTSGQSLNVFHQPLSTEGISPPLVHEPFFTTTAASASATSNNDTNNNGGCEANEKQPAAVIGHVPPPAPPQDSFLLHDIPIEAVMGNDSWWTAGNQEGGFPECDDFELPENMNWDDFDFSF